jgi:hypothetical protein
MLRHAKISHYAKWTIPYFSFIFLLQQGLYTSNILYVSLNTNTLLWKQTYLKTPILSVYRYHVNIYNDFIFVSYLYSEGGRFVSYGSPRSLKANTGQYLKLGPNLY